MTFFFFETCAALRALASKHASMFGHQRKSVRKFIFQNLRLRLARALSWRRVHASFI